jgi:hypothetical protein
MCIMECFSIGILAPYIGGDLVRSIKYSGSAEAIPASLFLQLLDQRCRIIPESGSFYLKLEVLQWPLFLRFLFQW